MPAHAEPTPFLQWIINSPARHLEIMDIGAMVEGEERYRSLVDQGLASVTGFEPNPAEYERLSNRVGPYSYHAVCLGDGNAATLHVTRYPGCTSLLEPDPSVIDAFSGIGASTPGGNFTVVEKVPVETTRLDDVEGCAAPDLIKLDIQGAELLVLENGPKTVSGALVIEVEVEFIPLYKEQPLFGEIQTFLCSKGFELHKFIDISGRCFRPLTRENPQAAMSQLLWADAVFVRSAFALDRLSDDELLKSAIILHDIYRSYDLVHRLLQELDKRTGSKTTADYAAFLGSGSVPPPIYMTQRDHG